MGAPCRVYEGHAADLRLRELGLTAQVLQVAVETGEAEARLCTANDPAMASGVMRHCRTVRSLRDQLAPGGWKRNNRRNLSRTVNPARDLAVITSLGDGRTGDPNPEVQPSTKYDKGVTIMHAVGVNGQLHLFDLPESASTVDEEILEDAVTWVLLYHVTRTEIRYELSLPVETTGGFISRWRERIVVPPLARESQVAVGGPDELPGPDIDVPVARR